MAIQTYGLNAERLGKYKAETLKVASAYERLSKVGRQAVLPKNNSRTYVARKWVPYGATATKAGHNVLFPSGDAYAGVDRSALTVQNAVSVEGVTSAATSIVPLDYSAVVQEFQVLFGFSNIVDTFYEDDIPGVMKDQVAPAITLINEQVIYGALQGCTNQYFGGTGTTIATVNDWLKLPLVRKIVRNLQANHAKPVNKVLKAGANYNTTAIPEGFLVFVHSDLEPDVRDMSGFTPAERYASGSPMPGEIGAVERFRFISCPDLPPILSAGASTGTYTTLQTSTSTAKADVYPVIVMGEDAFSQIAVRGVNAMDITFLPPGQKSKSDPLGQRGYAGALWYKQCLVENDNWMAVAFVATQKI